MSTLSTGPATGHSAVAERPHRSRRGWPHYLAAAAVPLMIYNVWTVVAWLADGPHEITRFRTGEHTRDWYGARILEGAVVLISVVVLYKIYQGCRQQRRLWTFDMLMLLAGASTWWANGVTNWFNPTWIPSTQFVNVNDPCSYMPLIPNTDCGLIPYPWLFLLCVESTLLVGFGMMMSWVLAKVRPRMAQLSKPRIWAILLAGGVACFLGEPLVIIQTGAWIYPGTPISMQIGPAEYARYPPFPELLIASSFLALAGGLRYFKDDQGRTVVERKLEHHSPRAQKVITFMALYLLAHVNLVGVATIPLWPMSFHQTPWPVLPATLNARLCDQPGGVTDTGRGPCPGSPAYVLRMPRNGNWWHSGADTNR
jgi:hypothetical protein